MRGLCGLCVSAVKPIRPRSAVSLPLIVPFLLLALLCPACSKRGESAGSEGEKAQIPTVHVKVATATRGNIAETVEVPGSIAALPNQDVKASSLVAGRILEVRAAEGETVRKGQLIARIDPSPYVQQRDQSRATLAQAEANLENARKDLARNRSLYEKGIAAGKEVQDSENQVRVTQAEVEKTKAALEGAQLQVARTQIYAPISGIVLHRLLNTGEQVSGTPSDPILEIANLDTVEMEARIPSRFSGYARVGQKLKVTTASYPGQVFQGEIIAVGGSVDPATDSVQARLQVRNPGNRLKVGMFAEGELTVQQHTNTTLVPASAVVKAENETRVYVVQGDTAAKKPVQVGIQNHDQAEILSGISPGEKVVTSGNYGLEDKAHIVIDK
ncbi:MAG TPA: efflux RND transporter periplasmic adaptor subunit [Acidobacteriota bacterium]|nr:efflux RND transporter periplasmic adaptor subunit [Acidobacteriota bacterium]